MFKPFTNTKTCVLFVQKREEPIDDIEQIQDDPPVVFAVTEKSGKDKSGYLVLDEQGEVVSDLPDISGFVKQNIIWD